jgi:integrase
VDRIAILGLPLGVALKRDGHIERLPSGSYRVKVYAGTDPLTGRELRFRRTVKTEVEAQIVLGELLKETASGKRPESAFTVAELLERYLEVAELESSTRETYAGYMRRTIEPALGSMEIRRVRGPILDTFYARLRRCGNLRCNGRPFTEHQAFPPLPIGSGAPRPTWALIEGAIRDAIRSGRLGPGQELPSARELADWYGLKTATVYHAMTALKEQGVIRIQQGRKAFVAGKAQARPQPDGGVHDCALAGCRPHQCRPMSAATIRQIQAILSGAFAAAARWEWIDGNPASSARLPKTRPRSPSSPTPSEVASVITAAQDQQLDLLAVYIWLAAVTGARRGELCALRWCDVDLSGAIVHVGSSYLVRGGLRVRKDTKTHQDRYLAIDPITVDVLAGREQQVYELLGAIGLALNPDSYVFTGDLAGTSPWNPDAVSHKVAAVAASTGVRLNVKALRHYSASQLLAGGIDLRNTAARLGHGGGGATTLLHYADPISEVDRRAAAYLSQLTAASKADRPSAGRPNR